MAGLGAESIDFRGRIYRSSTEAVAAGQLDTMNNTFALKIQRFCMPPTGVRRKNSLTRENAATFLTTTTGVQSLTIAP